MTKRWIAALAGVAVVAQAARRHAKMQLSMAAVPVELRSPILPLTSRSLSERSLWLGRLGMNVRNQPGTRCDDDRTLRRQRANGARACHNAVGCRRSQARLLHLHGGGMVVGSPQFEAFESGRLARELDAVVVSPNYRLAPEHPFPAALDDCMATLRWMRDHADELGLDEDRIAVMGSSAGGGLSAAVAQRSSDEGIELRAQVLVYPMMDDRTALRDDHGGRGKFMWTPASSRWAWTAYLGREPQMSDAPEYAAPARRTDLSGLPPAWVGVGDLDILYEEGVAYAERLKAHAVPCELVTVAGMYHGAHGIKPNVPAMRAFRRAMAEHLRTYL